MAAKIDPVPGLSDDELQVCWYAALAFGCEHSSVFNPKPGPITHLGAALRESIRRALICVAEEGEIPETFVEGPVRVLVPCDE